MLLPWSESLPVESGWQNGKTIVTKSQVSSAVTEHSPKPTIKSHWQSNLDSSSRYWISTRFSLIGPDLTWPEADRWRLWKSIIMQDHQACKSHIRNRIVSNRLGWPYYQLFLHPSHSQPSLLLPIMSSDQVQTAQNSAGILQTRPSRPGKIGQAQQNALGLGQTAYPKAGQGHQWVPHLQTE